jgi:hypothetical protein
MFTNEKILHWEIEFDKELTTQAYLSLPDQCNCGYCRNFQRVFKGLSSEFVTLLQKLGIDPAQPAEIVHYNDNHDGTHHYGWWYHFVGQIMSGDESWEDFAQGMKVEFRNKDELAPENFPRPIVQLEFLSNLPWVLAENP